MTTGNRSVGRPTSAPLGRLLLSELLLTVPRPRTAVTLGVVALVPLLVATGLASLGGESSFVLSALLVSTSEFAAFSLAVPVVLVAADAFAAERAHRTLDALTIAPVGLGRMLVLKATGIVAVAALTAATTTVIALVAGLVALDLGPFTFGATLGRALVIALWTTGQLVGLGMLLLPLSALSRRPATVAATGLAVAMASAMAVFLPGRLTPLLPAGSWSRAVTGLSRVPIDWSVMGWTTLRAVVYAVVGAGVTVWLLSRRDA
ncbi:ABC-2 type transport system permease protein [Pseudonocardia sediminis]|uniref:ABC-2 type transport system permease protein n=1 Tax=Pseudonocardia sediminis TaxID=1397368 RepID=A0A4Q7UTD0_PSEST|nr:hypothetical protein [Pseudonocardia sediminis]RZT84041.1 ABC-2 type transport system permease protein [Pseudonocardia sediminis]